VKCIPSLEGKLPTVVLLPTETRISTIQIGNYNARPILRTICESHWSLLECEQKGRIGHDTDPGSRAYDRVYRVVEGSRAVSVDMAASGWNM
jgi:hypothetical protein